MILVIDETEDLRDRISQLYAGVKVRAVPDLTDARLVLEDPTSGTETVVLGPSFDPEEAVEIAGLIRGSNPGMHTVLVVGEATSELLRKALRAGVSDLLGKLPTDDELREAIDQARELTGQMRTTTAAGAPTDETSQRRTIAVFSTKGGCGKSLVATNLAVLLAQEAPGEVCLVDLDLQSGDISVMMQLLPSWSIHDAANRGTELDADQLRGFLTDHPSGLKVLAAPSHPSLAEDVKPRSVAHIIALLRSMFRYVIIDGPALFTDTILEAFDQTDIVVVVTSMDVPSIKNLKLASQTLQELGIPRDRLRLVLNRADSKVGLSVREVESSLGTQIDGQIPSSREVPYSINQGQPVVLDRPRSPVSDALRTILDLVRPAPAGARPEAQDSGGVLSRWFK